MLGGAYLITLLQRSPGSWRLRHVPQPHAWLAPARLAWGVQMRIFLSALLIRCPPPRQLQT